MLKIIYGDVPQAVESKALGVISVTKLSGGTKTLLLILNEPEKIFNASTCGNNCAPFILKIADLLNQDITINLNSVGFEFFDFVCKKFSILCISAKSNQHRYIFAGIF